MRVPNSVEEALRIDKEEGNIFWVDEIEAEMKEVRPRGLISIFRAPMSEFLTLGLGGNVSL